VNPPLALGLAVAALAVVIWPGPGWSLYRVVEMPPPRGREARWLGVRSASDDPFAVAAAFDLFAVCLRAGLPIGGAARTVAGSAPTSLAGPLSEVADLLDLGADPDSAWSVLNVLHDSGKHGAAQQHLDALASMARRSSRAGSSLAAGLVELADDTRRQAHDAATAAAERAGVAISGPLGLCFLPAFICLGIVPVVIGLASTVLGGM